MPWHLGPARCPASPPKAGGAPPACTAPGDPTRSIPGSLLPTQPCAKWHLSRAVISSPAPEPVSRPPGGCALPCPAPSLQLPTAPALQRTRPAANKLPSTARMNAPALHGSKVLLLPDRAQSNFVAQSQGQRTPRALCALHRTAPQEKAGPAGAPRVKSARRALRFPPRHLTSSS